jgi:NAD(P)H-hydrate epimerase
MVHPAAETAVGSLAASCLDDWNRKLEDHEAILLGPGMTTHEDTAAIVRDVLARWEGPLVLDADALNVLDAQTIRQSRSRLVITPHPGELARLLGCSAADIQADRFGAAREAVNALGCVVVLKGAGTIVATEDHALCVNLTGNPGMARGGMGDVLAGLLAGLMVQGVSPRDAARLAVFLHGRAADRVAWSTSQAGMKAGDVADALAGAFGELVPR